MRLIAIVLLCSALALAGCTTTTTSTRVVPVLDDSGKQMTDSTGKPLTQTITTEETDTTRHYNAYVNYEKSRKPMMKMVAAKTVTTVSKYDGAGNLVSTTTTEGVAPIQITGAALWEMNFPGQGVRPYESQIVSGLKAGLPYLGVIAPLLYPLLGINSVAYSGGGGSGLYVDGNLNVNGGAQSPIAIASDHMNTPVAIGGSGAVVDGVAVPGGAATINNVPSYNYQDSSQDTLGMNW